MRIKIIKYLISEKMVEEVRTVLAVYIMVKSVRDIDSWDSVCRSLGHWYYGGNIHGGIIGWMEDCHVTAKYASTVLQRLLPPMKIITVLLNG